MGALGRRGAVSVEVGLLVLPVILLLFITVEVGRAARTHAALHYAAERAARCAAITPTTCGSSTAVNSFAAGLMNSIAVPAGTFTLATAPCGRRVSASYSFQSVVAGLLPRSITLSAASCYPA